MVVAKRVVSSVAAPKAFGGVERVGGGWGDVWRRLVATRTRMKSNQASKLPISDKASGATFAIVDAAANSSTELSQRITHEFTTVNHE